MSLIDTLKAELTADPLTRGYAGMTDAQAATDMMTAYRTRNRATMTASEVYNAIDQTEWAALLPTAQDEIWNILQMGTLNPFGREAARFVAIFGAASATITALQAARKGSISRAEELGLGVVKPGHVEEARR